MPVPGGAGKLKQGKNSFIISAAVVAAAELLLVAWLIHMKFEPAWMAVMIVLSLAACVIHIRQAASDPQYLLKVAGVRQSGKGRIPQLDHLRVIAVSGVILTHVIQVDLESYKAPALYGANILWVLTLAANVIYVMLSGALLYRWKQEPLRRFYFRRFTTVVIPLCIYYLWYTAVNYHLGRGWDWVSLKSVPHWIIANEMREAPHFWLIYVILSIYVTVPLFRLIFRSTLWKDFTKALFAIFFFCILSLVLLPYAELAVKLPITGWLLVSLFGYWVCQEDTRRYDRFLIGAGLAAGVALAILAVKAPDVDFLDTYFLNDKPLTIVFCLGIFAAVCHFQGFFSRFNPVTASVSKYSYGIMLIHWWSLHFVVRARLSVSSMSFHYLGIPVSLVLVVIISWFFCLIADNLLVMPVRKVFEAIAGVLDNKQI